MRKQLAWALPYCTLTVSFMGVILAVTLAACAALEKPQTPVEQAMYAEATAQGAIKTLVDLTCLKYSAEGVCADPAKLLHPARADVYLSAISKARTALRQMGDIPPTGVGNCLGAPTSQAECLRLAQSILTDVQRVLTELQKKGGT